jgi:hypothetical protein
MDFITTQSTIDNISLEAIAAFVQKELIAKPKLAGTITDLSAAVGPGMDSIKLPRFNSFVAERKVAARHLTKQKLTSSPDQLYLVKHDAVLTEIENIAQLQSSVDLQMLYAERIASAMKKKEDQEIFEELKLSSESSPDHRVAFASGSTLTKADFTNSIKLMLDAEIELGDGTLWLAAPTAQYKAILELSDFVDADKWGSGSEVIKGTGALGRAYGFNIIVSTVFDKPVFYHSTACAFARQKAISYMQAPLPKNLSVELAADHVYGVKQMQGGKAAIVIG